MTKPRVYIETTIPSFYHEVRTEPEMVVKRQWTRDWWDEYRIDYELFTSEVVLTELNNGDYPNKEMTVEMVDGLPLFAVDAARETWRVLHGAAKAASRPPCRISQKRRKQN